MGLMGLMVWGCGGVGVWEVGSFVKRNAEAGRSRRGAGRRGEGKWRVDIVDLRFGVGWQDASATGVGDE
jgi:hypothetical protein